jgi:hypothetical protein
MNERVYFTIGTLWKQEDTYARDFITLARYLGAERFIIYDREYRAISEMFKNEPDIIVKPYEESPSHLHSHAWASLIADTQSTGAYPSSWLALIDADEMVIPVKTDDIKEMLKQYEDFASLQLNWHTFGNSFHETRTEGSLYERFIMRAKPEEGINAHTQAIVQPDRVLAQQTADPHHVRLPAGEVSVNTNRGAVVGPFNRPHLHDVAWIYHAYTKSKQEWAEKNGKGRADIYGTKVDFTLYDQYNKFANDEKEDRVLALWNKANQ